MPKRGNPPMQGELLQGTLDVLVLKTLAVGAAHGHTIAHAIAHCIRRCTVSRTAAGSHRSGARPRTTGARATTGSRRPAVRSSRRRPLDGTRSFAPSIASSVRLTEHDHGTVPIPPPRPMGR